MVQINCPDYKYLPGDIKTSGINHFHKAECDTLSANLVRLFHIVGNSWQMPLDTFTKTLTEINAKTKTGGLTSFVGLNDLERIKQLGILEIDEGAGLVKFTDNFVEEQIKRNVKRSSIIRYRLVNLAHRFKR